mmetsp:Transcript_4377/g.9703  ORF Transcript_4377/g.9703 Transcript_4377/m.9703 type:complete len:214 (-) Transcript_4377:360-1001(-)
MKSASFLSVIISRLATKTSSALAYSPPLNKGLEIRVCQDKDCLLDGSKETLALVESMVDDDQQIAIAPCGCLGPCGKGPTVDVRIDGLRVKDTREGMDDYFLFRKIDSAKAVADMLDIAGIEQSSQDDNAISDAANKQVASTRQWYNIDRNSKITLQRILYALVALPLLNAHLNGTWDEIRGVTVPNSYYGIAAAVFVASQFMGTSQKSNSME